MTFTSKPTKLYSKVLGKNETFYYLISIFKTGKTNKIEIKYENTMKLMFSFFFIVHFEFFEIKLQVTTKLE